MMKKRINVSAKIQARHTPSGPMARRDMASNHSRHQNGVGFAVVTSYYPWTYKSDRRIAGLELSCPGSLEKISTGSKGKRSTTPKQNCQKLMSPESCAIHHTVATCFVLRDSCVSHVLSVNIYELTFLLMCLRLYDALIACTFWSVSCFTSHPPSARFIKSEFGAVKKTMMRQLSLH